MTSLTTDWACNKIENLTLHFVPVNIVRVVITPLGMNAGQGVIHWGKDIKISLKNFNLMKTVLEFPYPFITFNIIVN